MMVIMIGVVLSGGKSRRMGRDKVFLQWKGEYLISRVLNVLGRVFDSVMIIADSPERFREFRYPVVCDLIPERGPLGGIYTALHSANSDAIFAVGCDFPFLHEDLIRYLMDLIPGYDAVVPRRGGLWHPLHAAYSRRCLPIFKQQIEEGELSLRDALLHLAVREVGETELQCLDPEMVSLTNLNTPADLRRALSKSRRMPCIR